MAEEELELDGLACTDCSAKIEKEVNQLEENRFRFRQIRVLIGALLFAAGFLLDLNTLGTFLLYGMAYLTVGIKVLTATFQNLLRGEVFDENFLMTVATVGAFAIGEYPEGVAVMLFYEVGEIVQSRAVDRSRRAIKDLLDIKAKIAHLKKEGSVETVNPEKVKVGEQIIIKPGEKVPLDGKIIEGISRIDDSALTGESVPKRVEVGDEILSGAVNKNGLLTVEVREEFSDSTVSRILNLVQNAAEKKAPTEKFITKFAKYYTPAVVLAALLLAFLPPLFISGAVFSDWIYRALVFLVISCPCALVVSIPLGFFGGIGSASRQGILVKGGNYLEGLNNLDTLVVDKTGTLTEGVFEVSEVLPAESWSEEDLLSLAVKAEVNSNHPIAEALRKAWEGDIPSPDRLDKYQELPGRGIKAVVDGVEMLVGNHKLMEESGVNYNLGKSTETVVHIACNGDYAGRILIDDRLREDSLPAVKELKSLGIEKIVMLTGDSKAVASKIAKKLGINNYYAELLPDDKVAKVEELLDGKEKKEKVAFVGDGINDAPVLARSDIGIAMGGLGSDAAIEAADIVLMKDKLSDLLKALKIAKFTRKVVVQNIVLALGVKGIVLFLGMFGLASMWGAVFADVGVALLAVFNALRIIHKK